MARTTKRNRRRSSHPRSLPAGMQRARPPKTRLKALFQVLVDVSATAEKAMLTVPLPQEESQKRLLMFDAGVLLRASNALQAVRVLCEEAHWEFAAILRQLFELVINMDEARKQGAPFAALSPDDTTPG